MSTPSPLARFDVVFSRELMRWFADLPPPERVHVMAAKHSCFVELRQRFPKLPPAEVDMAALLTVFETWSMEAQSFATSRALPPEALARIARCRQSWAKSLGTRHSGAKSWLARNWGKIKDLKKTGTSLRKIERILGEKYHVKISYGTIRNYLLLWEK
jgi:hypothetical protein